jgi:hypothetical protein
MNKKTVRWLVSGLLAAVLGFVAVAAVAQARGGDNDNSISKIRAATARYHDIKAAQADGWDLRPGLDKCFDQPGTGGMGFHYINLTELQDLTEDPLRPEALVYAPTSWGQQDLAAVEYIVPQKEWDAAGNTAPPELLGQRFHLDPTLGVYILHAWIFKDNPSGIFADFNPKVLPCPAT